MNKDVHSALPKHAYVSTDKLESVEHKRHCLVFKTLKDKFLAKGVFIITQFMLPLNALAT